MSKQNTWICSGYTGNSSSADNTWHFNRLVKAPIRRRVSESVWDGLCGFERSIMLPWTFLLVGCPHGECYYTWNCKLLVSHMHNPHEEARRVCGKYLPRPLSYKLQIPGYLVDKQEIQALQTIHDILTDLLKPLSDAACQKGNELACADVNVWLSYHELFYWLADHMENATIHGIASNWCPICTTPTKKLGEYMASTYPARSHTNYAVAYGESHVMRPNVYGLRIYTTPYCQFLIWIHMISFTQIFYTISFLESSIIW